MDVSKKLPNILRMKSGMTARPCPKSASCLQNMGLDVLWFDQVHPGQVFNAQSFILIQLIFTIIYNNMYLIYKMLNIYYI